jgi:nitrilase
MKLAIAQIAPVFMNRDATLSRVRHLVQRAAAAGSSVVAFGETFVPGYPVWLSRTDGAQFEDPVQKELHAIYVDQAVCIEAGHLSSICEAAAAGKINVVLGITERPRDRGGYSLFASRVFIDASGTIASIHRKLMPTYEERLCWGMGDGHGLVTHRVESGGEVFTIGALNCWENWMPLARAAIYAAGADVIIMHWPGREWNTRDITRFVAMESRSYVVSASALLREEDIARDFPQRDRIVSPGEMLHDGGSCIAGPDGKWIVEPVTGREELITAELDAGLIRRERQSRDPAGHYARPDVLRLVVDRRRQAAADWVD